MHKKLKVLIIFDDATPLDKNKSYEEILSEPNKQAEKDIYDALIKLGHEARLLAITDDLKEILKEIRYHPPDIIFNQVEQFAGDPIQEKNVIGFFEMLKIPHTGTGSIGLMLCKNKGIAKKILTHHRIKTPDFHVFHKGHRIHPLKKLKYPMIVKPLKHEASYGISMNSFVENDKNLIERVQFIQESMNEDAIVEEYVDGRELYVGVLGNHRLQVFPTREMVFTEMPEDEPKIATFKAKWDEKYREKWGIKNRFANPLPQGIDKVIEKICKKAYLYLYLSGYARLDLRFTPENEVVVIEANPNPFVAKEEDFALAAAKSGMEYEQLIQKILNYGLGHAETDS